MSIIESIRGQTGELYLSPAEYIDACRLDVTRNDNGSLQYRNVTLRCSPAISPLPLAARIDALPNPARTTLNSRKPATSPQ